LLNFGVDIIECDSFPSFIKGDEYSFFLYNYTKSEIEFAKKQINPDIEFIKMFSIKESLVKSDKLLTGKNFNKIELSFVGNCYIYNDYKITTSTGNNNCISFVLSTT
tara:strand:- start:323 stop:643 length:321 start_codon:yes stop_codon:yes gene_type:complete